MVKAIRKLLDAGNVAMSRPAVEAGLATLEAGGDFVDGVIVAHEGYDSMAKALHRSAPLLAKQGTSTKAL